MSNVKRSRFSAARAYVSAFQRSRLERTGKKCGTTELRPRLNAFLERYEALGGIPRSKAGD